ncbi:hypothetical protein H0H92_007022 [Tricholoma furcatifolium]|nr:hypothetical protein H0H92_007022 [Tricholoma furcatifolium]
MTQATDAGVLAPEERKSQVLSNVEGGQETEDPAVANVDIGGSVPAPAPVASVAVPAPMTPTPVVKAVPEIPLAFAPVLVAPATPTSTPLATSAVNTVGPEALPVPSIMPAPLVHAIPEVVTSLPVPAAGGVFDLHASAASPTALMDNFLDMFDTPLATGNGANNFSFDTTALADYDWSTTSAYFAQLNAAAPNALVSEPPTPTPVILPAMPTPVIPPVASTPVIPAAAPVPVIAAASPSLVIAYAEPAPQLPIPPAISGPLSGGLASVDTVNTSFQHSRSGRQITASKKAEEMNKIGGPNPRAPAGKENIPPTAEARPAWRIAAEAHLMLTDYGAEWENCVKAWIAVENTITSAGSRSGLPAKLRPDEWQKWIARSSQGSRSYEACPVIDDPLEFGYAMMAWWKQLQPEFRASLDNVLPHPIYELPVEGTDPWATLRKGGPNGLVAVMTLLLWWRQAFRRCTHWQDDSQPFWTCLVQDVQLCLNKIVSTPAAQKRKRGADATTSSKR